MPFEGGRENCGVLLSLIMHTACVGVCSGTNSDTGSLLVDVLPVLVLISDSLLSKACSSLLDMSWSSHRSKNMSRIDIVAFALLI